MRYGLGFQSCIVNLDKWMKPYIKEHGFEYYEYIFTHTDDTMTIRNECGKSIKILEEAYILGGLKVLFYKYSHYLGKKVVLYDANKSFGGKQEIKPSMSADQSLDKVIPVIEKFYNISNYLSKLFCCGNINLSYIPPSLLIKK